MKGIKRYLLVLSILGIIILAWWIGFKTSFIKKYESETSTVMLDRIEKVFKLVAVEGNVSEIYDYKDYYNFDISPFRKKALLRVTAKVSAGFDFEKLEIEVDDNSKAIIIKNIPNAEILSIDHDLDYYDITQGTFNRFSNEDYNTINARAKSYIAEKAKDSGLISSAEEQKQELLEMLRLLVSAGGWQMKVEKETFLN